jgi:protein arginine N-methyltransferase 6
MRALSPLLLLLAPLALGTKDDYFHGYDVWSNLEMLSDRHRTRSYEEAFHQGRSLFAGKVVVDVGCGTGILSLMAARAGAKKVYCIDANPLTNQVVPQIVGHNNYTDVIQVVIGNIDLATFSLPEKGEVLISEWMGYFLWAEDMFRTVAKVRDQWMHPGFTMWPSHGKLYFQPLASKLMREYISTTFWENVYGFDMSRLPEKMEQHDEMFRGYFHPRHLVGEPAVLDTYDFTTLKYDTLRKKELPFNFTFAQEVSNVIGLVFWSAHVEWCIVCSLRILDLNAVRESTLYVYFTKSRTFPALW